MLEHAWGRKLGVVRCFRLLDIALVTYSHGLWSWKRDEGRREKKYELIHKRSCEEG